MEDITQLVSGPLQQGMNTKHEALKQTSTTCILSKKNEQASFENIAIDNHSFLKSSKNSQRSIGIKLEVFPRKYQRAL